MNILISIIAMLSGTIALLGVIKPTALQNFFEELAEKIGFYKIGFYATVGGRIVVGLLFLIASPQCLYPDVIFLFGLIIIMAGILIAILGRDELDEFLTFFVKLPPTAVRIWAFTSLSACAFLIYASGWPPLG